VCIEFACAYDGCMYVCIRASGACIYVCMYVMCSNLNEARLPIYVCMYVMCSNLNEARLPPATKRTP